MLPCPLLLLVGCRSQIMQPISCFVGVIFGCERGDNSRSNPRSPHDWSRPLPFWRHASLGASLAWSICSPPFLYGTPCSKVDPFFLCSTSVSFCRKRVNNTEEISSEKPRHDYSRPVLCQRRIHVAIPLQATRRRVHGKRRGSREKTGPGGVESVHHPTECHSVGICSVGAI